jgi:transposase
MMAARQSAAVDRAVDLVVKQGLTPYAAAKKEGLALSTIYRALKRLHEAAAKGEEKK